MRIRSIVFSTTLCSRLFLYWMFSSRSCRRSSARWTEIVTCEMLKGLTI
ncbi:MAG: hypothetical protein ACHQ1G_00965 [Planctomycetota bacterium]